MALQHFRDNLAAINILKANRLIGDLDNFGAEMLRLLAVAERKRSKSSVVVGEGGGFIHGFVLHKIRG
jgi:hypothetical protein